MGFNGERAVEGPAELPAEGRDAVERLCDADRRVAAQAWAAIADLRTTLAALGLGLAEVVRLTVYLQDIDDFPAVDAMWRACAEGALPALLLVEIPAPGPLPDLRLSLEAVAWRG